MTTFIAARDAGRRRGHNHQPGTGAGSPPAAAPPQWPSAAYPGSAWQAYRIQAPTPEDAYRDGTINRWQLEQLAGPLPEALQGPSVDGNRAGDGGGDESGQ